MLGPPDGAATHSERATNRGTCQASRSGAVDAATRHAREARAASAVRAKPRVASRRRVRRRRGAPEPTRSLPRALPPVLRERARAAGIASFLRLPVHDDPPAFRTSTCSSTGVAVRRAAARFARALASARARCVKRRCFRRPFRARSASTFSTKSRRPTAATWLLGLAIGGNAVEVVAVALSPQVWRPPA